MRAGRLRHRVDIEEFAQNKSTDTGAVTEAWATVATVWASVEPLKGREFIEASQVQSNLSHRVRMRYRPGVTTSHRLVHNGRALNIVSVANLEERNIELEIMCMEAA